MGAAVLQKQFESLLGGHLGWQAKPVVETVPSGVAEIDRATGGLPRGCLTEIFGAPSSGRASLLASILAGAGARQEFCALVDAEDAFDPVSAAAAGVELARLLWIRCCHNAEHALRAADLLLQGGGFGVLALDLGDTPAPAARRISLTSWFRLRRAVEHTPTVLIAVERQSNAGTCASLMLELSRERVRWRGGKLDSARLLGGMRVVAARRKPGRAITAAFDTVWGQTTLSQGAVFAPRGPCGLSPTLSPSPEQSQGAVFAPRGPCGLSPERIEQLRARE